MPGITDLIQRLEEAQFRFRPGAAPQDIQALEATLGCTLPPEMAALYQHGDGMLRLYKGEYNGEPVGDMFRLVTISEAREMHPHLKQAGFDYYGRRCFWTDDASNYAALYVEGPLAGRICLLEHDGPDPAPQYRSVFSFLEAVAATGKTASHDALPGDYPALGPRDTEDTQRDLDAIQELRPLFEAADYEVERQLYAYSILVLTPCEQTDLLLPFTHDQDFYIQAKACDILGLRRYEPAIPRLAEVALHDGVSNGKSAAIRALGKIGTGAALRELVRVHEALPVREASDWWYHFADCGCEINKSNRYQQRYREPGTEEWKSLRQGFSKSAGQQFW